MKKNLLSFILCFLAICLFGTLNAQEPIYQLSNGNFENGWYRETSNAGSIVPVGFNSFYSGAGSLIGTASAQRQDSSRDVRAGATGAFSLRMYSTTVLGIRANGNVTTGRIYASSMTANNAGNYNYTDYAPSSTTTPPNPSKFCPEITGTPDSLRFWVKYLPGRTGATNTTDRGRIRVYIHGIGECRDAPQYPSGMTEVQLYYGKAMKEFYKEDGGWHCYQVPFEYTGNNDQRNDNGNFHVLVSMTTNATPGGGANNADQVWFDDIEFVYSAWLSDLQVNGETFEDFEQSTLEYFIELTGQAPYEFPYQPEDFTCIKESNWAQVADPVNIPGPTGDADKGYTSIVVTANDGSTKEYKIRYASNPSSDNTITGLSYTLDGENAIAVSGVNPATLSYTTTLQDPDETRIPQVREEDVILSDPYATITFINQPKSVNNSVAAITVRAEDFSTKIYTLNFSKPISSNSKLAMIRVAGVPVADFHADTLVYEHHIDMCATSNAMLAVTAVASSVWANISYTQATLTNRTATILVMAEDSTQTTYTINFILTNDNTTLLGYRVGSTNRNNSFNAGNDYTDVYSTNFTAVPALSLSTTSGQQGCAGQQVIFQPAIFFPDTNFIKVTAQNGVDTQMYRSVLKSTNCYVATGANNGFRYNYGGLTDQNTGINITTANNNNTNTITTTVVTLPIGPPTPPELVVRAFTTTVALPTAHIVQPTHRNDTAIVTVVANDGTTQKIYRIPFRATLSPDATLSNITYDGFQVPGFNPTRELYTLIFPSNVTEVPDIEFTPSFQWLPEENIVFTPAASLSDTATIEVTAENGTTKRTYRIVFEVVEQEKDAYLTDIRYNNVTISGFNPTTFNYTIDIPYSAPTPPAIAAYASSPTALVFYATQLNTPPYTQRILVFSEDMTVNKIYTVDFNLVKNTNAALEDIQINGVSLQDFNSEVFAYDYELHYTELDAPVVSATPAFEHAQVVVNQINTTTGTVAIHVTAEDETYTEVYTVHFTRELSPVTAIEAIEYEYNEQIYMHDVTVSGTEIIIMLPVETEGEPMIDHVVLADHRADFVIDEQPDEANDFTGTVTVTAEDATEEIYEIIFERTLSGSTLLTGIYVNGTLLEGFDPEVTTYTMMLPFDNTQIPVVTATVHWQNTDFQITQATNIPGQATVEVTSENGQHTQIYTINFQRKGTPYLVSLSYNLDGTSYPIPGFDPEILNYDNVLLPIATTSTPELEYVLEDNRCTVVPDYQTTPNGTSQLEITTWNGDASLTYTVTFVVELCTTPTLSDLQVDGVTIPGFSPNILNYSVYLPFGTEELPVVTGEITCLDGELEITQITEYPGVVYIKVTAGNGDTQTYTISFSVDPGNNTYLSMIFINGEVLAEFNKNVYFYEKEMTYGLIQAPTVDATPEDPRSEVSFNQAILVGDTAKIYVTALNGDVALYQVYFKPGKNNNCYVENIWIDWELMEDFNPYVSEYVYLLPANYTGTPLVTVELQDPNATKKEEWLATAPPTWQITVTAEDGEKTCTYRIAFERDTVNSILTFDNKTAIRVYPNPSSDNIHFKIDDLMQTGYLEIYSVENKKLGSYILQGGVNTIQIGHLSNGIYFYKIFTDKAMLGAGKFVKN